MNRIPRSLIVSVERDFPALKEAVAAAKDNPEGSVVFGLDMFAGKPTMLLNCIWYATSLGASVTFQGMEQPEILWPEGHPNHKPRKESK